MVYFRLNIKYLIISIILMSACANFSAYFNTFYNAMEHFDQAESIRKKSENNNISKTALDLYLSSIEKSKYSSNSSTIDLFFKSSLESSTGCVAIFLSSNDEFSTFDNSSIEPVTS